MCGNAPVQDEHGQQNICNLLGPMQATSSEYLWHLAVRQPHESGKLVCEWA